MVLLSHSQPDVRHLMEGVVTTLTEQYASLLTNIINNIALVQKESIHKAATAVKDVLAADGLIYVFGCGHSHMLAEETFYRAGGLACVYPLFCGPLMLHESAQESSHLEKEAGFYRRVLDGLSLTERDMLFVVSTSGVNAVPVELADAVHSRGIPVIGISSSAYASQEARNPLGKHLSEVCSLCLDNVAPHGDACLQPEGLPIKMTPVSTITSAFILNSILAEGTQLALHDGVEVPVYMSGNIPGGAEYNRSLIERFQKRIPNL